MIDRVVHADVNACRDDRLLTELSMLMTVPVERTVSRVFRAYDHFPDCVDRITLVGQAVFRCCRLRVKVTE